MKSVLLFFLICPLLFSCANRQVSCPNQMQRHSNHLQNQSINQVQLLNDLKILSADDMQGRRSDTQGSLNAQRYITNRFTQLGIKSFNKNYLHHFDYGMWGHRHGVNLVGFKRGSVEPEKYLVISAHYDHLGKVGGKIFHGADDNASGVSAMLAIAEYFADKPSHHSLIFLATDAEEDGLFGAKAFLASPPVELQALQFNLNIDMVSHGGVGKKLYVAGTRKNTQFIPLINQVTHNAGICLRTGHEGRQYLFRNSLSDPDWRNAGDHAPFNKANIAYLYFGVDLHRNYHQPSDTFENIDQQFFGAATETILKTLLLVDQG